MHTRKIISLILAVMLLFTAVPLTLADAGEPAVHFYGDVSFDDILNTADAALILRYCAGIIQFTEDRELALTSEGFMKADGDKNGKINTADAVYVLKFSAGMILSPNTYTDEPVTEPTTEPTQEPTATPTQQPTSTPTGEPTATPTQQPTPELTPGGVWNGEDVSETLNGSGTDASPFQIWSAADLAYMAKNIKGTCKGVEMVSASYRVMCDIYFNEEGMLDEDYELVFEPNRFGGIGTGTDVSTWFTGKFNGNNKTIHGLYMKNQSYNGATSGIAVGFFAGIKSPGLVYNLNFVDAYVWGNRANVADNKNAYIGGVCGVLVANQSSMTSASVNLRNICFDGRVKCSGESSGLNTTGGIIGIMTAAQDFHKGRVDGLVMRGRITTNLSGITYANGMHYLKDAGGIGGICGAIGETRCNITSLAQNIQSFSAAYVAPEYTTFRSCVNYAKVEVLKLRNTDVSGEYSVTEAVGGIVARIHGAERAAEQDTFFSRFEECANYGDIIVPTAYMADNTTEVRRLVCVGGIAGTSFSRATKFIRCAVKCNIESGNNGYVAGILANRINNTFNEEYSFEYCYVKGTMKHTGKQLAHILRGGIAGTGFTTCPADVTFKSCWCGTKFMTETASETRKVGIMAPLQASNLTGSNCYYLLSGIKGFDTYDADAAYLSGNGVSEENEALAAALNGSTEHFVFANGEIRLAWES